MTISVHAGEELWRGVGPEVSRSSHVDEEEWRGLFPAAMPVRGVVGSTSGLADEQQPCTPVSRGGHTVVEEQTIS